MKRLCYYLEELGSCYWCIMNIELACNVSYCDRVYDSCGGGKIED